jgi:MFS family permease
MCAPALPDILEEFRSTSKIESTLVLMIWELGEVVCPLVVAPLCELYGRLPVYHVANLLFLAFTIGAAESTSISR